MNEKISNLWNWIKNYWCILFTAIMLLFLIYGIIQYYQSISDISNWIQACFAVILTIFTINYANSTKYLVQYSNLQNEIMEKQSDSMIQQSEIMDRQSKIIEKQYETETEPNVICYVQVYPSEPNKIMMIIQNIGRGIAYNLKFTSEPDFESVSGSLNNNYDIFNPDKGLSYMAPGQKIEFVLTNFREDSEKKRENGFSIVIGYNNLEKKPYEKKYPIELYQFWGLRYIPEKPAQITINAPINTEDVLLPSVLLTESHGNYERMMEPASYAPEIIDDGTSKQNIGFENQTREYKHVKDVPDTKNEDINNSESNLEKPNFELF